MLIVFEGIDGSGKTTLSNRVARELRQAGLRVRHVREDGKLASPVSEGLRLFTKNPLHLALTPMAELLLYTARETQLLEEVTRPALAEYEVVIADRFLYTAEVLARWGRGLPEESVRPVMEACARGLQPDRVFLIDVDPAIARARRRLSKVLVPDTGVSSRKGLAGAGMQTRLRAGYRALAAENPERWSLVENTDVTLDTLVTLLTQEVLGMVRGSARQTLLPTPSVAPAPRSPEEARARYLERVDRWMQEEPPLAAFFLSGLEGPDIQERRDRLAMRCPELIAYGLGGLTGAHAWRLRERVEEAAPVHVLGSLKNLAADSPEAWAIRERWETRQPEAVAQSMDGLDSERAWALRERLWATVPEAVLTSLGRIGSERAWEQRERWLTARGGVTALAQEKVARLACKSIRGLDDERAWDWRQRTWETAPDAVLRTLQGLDGERAWALREQHVVRAAKLVLESLEGLDSPRAWALRESFGVQCEEALESFEGMEGATAWKLRHALADTWPAASVKSLGPLAQDTRGRELITRLLADHPRDFALLRQAARMATVQERELRDAHA
ncbi:dTMP kinase [Melittangium boletus]|uniref:Thymidylate kinase n=1 Tax=Melittangium boletus DSM 14713 TaxID=1294270 RepID=A0A250IKF2_9BACT|nr:dTMP kinase [Melittangium boletus]ATB31700.1 thymidylate kinase [Melittangium boletus DSM 14713]